MSVRPRTQRFPGRLFAVEGCDGSGKSTQMYLLARWLREQGYPVFRTEWNSSPLVHPHIKRAKKAHTLTPTTYSLVHASDFADRYESLILPHLQAGYIVLADRYVYTAMARDVVRGCDPAWVRDVYSFAVRPDTTFYYDVPLEVSLQRILSGRKALKYYEAGLDLGLAGEAVASFRLYQGLLLERYRSMARRARFVLMDGTIAIHELQELLRRYVQAELQGWRPPANLQPGSGNGDSKESVS